MYGSIGRICKCMEKQSDIDQQIIDRVLCHGHQTDFALLVVYLHSDIENNEFNIVIVEGTGDMMIPAEWLLLKSWKNGKVVYDKKVKNLTPEQAREKTMDGRSFITSQFVPIE